jgi:hypothetical protein
MARLGIGPAFDWDEASLAGLVQARLRMGEISERNVRAALCFSGTLPPVGATVGVDYQRWFPFGWDYNELVTPLSEFAQEPRTRLLNRVCQMALGGAWCRTPGDFLPNRTEAWMARRGFGVYGTGGVGNHPPYEIQSDDNVERDTEREQVRVERFQIELVRAYNATTDDPTPVPGPGAGVSFDIACQWFVRQGAFAGEIQPTKILTWLRGRSTVEYCAILGASVYGPWPPEERLGGLPFGQTELLLVSTLLGGPPL